MTTAATRSPWWTIAGISLGMTVSFSPAMLSVFGLYLKPMIADLGWSRTDVSLGVSLISVVAVMVTPLAGILIDRFGSKPVILGGCLLLPLSMTGFSLMPPLYWAFLCCAGLAGVAASVSAPSTFLTVPPQWFDKNLGRALALSIAGGSVGQLLSPLLTQRVIQSNGWRGAWLAMAAIVAGIGIPNCLALIRDNDALRRARRSAADSPLMAGQNFRSAIATLNFWLLSMCFALGVTVGVGFAFHAPALLTDRGYTPAQSAWMPVIMGGSSIAGRLVTGTLLDFVPFGRIAALCFLGQGLGCVLMWTGWSGPAPFIAAGLVGFGLGGEGDVLPYTLRRLFGLRAFGKLYGLSFGLYQVGSIIGPSIMGMGFDHFHSYSAMLLVLAAIAASAASLVALSAARTNAAMIKPPATAVI